VAVESRDLLLQLVIVVLGGGFLGALVAWRRAKHENTKTDSESTNIMVTTAQLLVGISREEIDRLDQERDRLRVRIDEIEHELGKRIAELEAERDRLHDELQAERQAKFELERQNVELHSRVRALEEEVTQLRENGT
jgi:predicted  nucleic acid-binding Zn-ribbon protein